MNVLVKRFIARDSIRIIGGKNAGRIAKTEAVSRHLRGGIPDYFIHARVGAERQRVKITRLLKMAQGRKVVCGAQQTIALSKLEVCGPRIEPGCLLVIL